MTTLVKMKIEVLAEVHDAARIRADMQNRTLGDVARDLLDDDANHATPVEGVARAAKRGTRPIQGDHIEPGHRVYLGTASFLVTQVTPEQGKVRVVGYRYCADCPGGREQVERVVANHEMLVEVPRRKRVQFAISRQNATFIRDRIRGSGRSMAAALEQRLTDYARTGQ